MMTGEAEFSFLTKLPLVVDGRCEGKLRRQAIGYRGDLCLKIPSIKQTAHQSFAARILSLLGTNRTMFRSAPDQRFNRA